MLNSQGFPEPHDHRWQGGKRDEGRLEPVYAADTRLMSVRFMQMDGGGPHDGGVVTVLELSIRKGDGSYAEPVSIMLSPEDSVGLVGACIGVSEGVELDGEDEDWGG